MPLFRAKTGDVCFITVVALFLADVEQRLPSCGTIWSPYGGCLEGSGAWVAVVLVGAFPIMQLYTAKDSSAENHY